MTRHTGWSIYIGVIQMGYSYNTLQLEDLLLLELCQTKTLLLHDDLEVFRTRLDLDPTGSGRIGGIG